MSRKSNVLWQVPHIILGNSLVASSMKRKTIVSAVAIEAPCICQFFELLLRVELTYTIDLVSFMWLVTGAYAEQRVELGPGYYPFEDGAFNLPLAGIDETES